MFQTPDGLYPTEIAIKDERTIFILAHPVGDGPVDIDTSVLFLVDGSEASVLRVFPYEITGITCCNGSLYLVDLEADLHTFDGEAWQDFTGSGSDAVRINALRTLDEVVVGIAGDGLLYRWHGNNWQPITEVVTDLYLYDVAHGPDGKIWVAAERGHISILSGRELQRIPIDTDVDITCVLPLGDTGFILTGWKATLIIGDATRTTFVDPEGHELAFLNVVHWNGKLLVACSVDICVLNSTRLELFSPHPAKRLHSGHGRLLCNWENGVAEFIGERWIEIPLSVEIE